MFFSALALVAPALVSCHALRPVPLAYLPPPRAWSPVRAPPTPGSWPCCKDCTLPLRTTIDRLHRDLLLGEPGRLYSELAASWLGVMAVRGIVLVVLHRRRVGRGRCARVTLVPCPGEANTYRRTRSCHTATGVWLALDFLFLASSGLTWSAHAGENVSQLRSALHWTAPKVSTALPGSAQRQGVGDEHAEHHGHQAHTGHSSPGSSDAVLTSARTAGLGPQLVEIRPAKSRDAAWTVAENDRPRASWVWWWALRHVVAPPSHAHRGRGFRPRTPTAVRCCSWWVSAWGCSCRCWASRSWRCSRRISRSPSSHNAAWPGNPRTDHSCGRCSPNGPRRLNGCRSLHEQHP